jgi:hypothetical protein
VSADTSKAEVLRAGGDVSNGPGAVIRVGWLRLCTQELPARTRMSRLALGHVRARVQGDKFHRPMQIGVGRGGGAG